ncbi:hypothetical protein BDQ17DRAFT_1334102 [Cyathus striatus]|nr:hypothetical protein BDQ17DRAFT_1334102 [Cyathus striatus]
MTNFAASWVAARSVIVTSNDTRVLLMVFAESLTGMVAILITDTFLAWRCYILWFKNKWLLALFAILLLGEVVIVESLLSASSSAIGASFYAGAILIPVAGIAPTLISERVIASREQEEDRYTRTTSLRFRHTTLIDGTLQEISLNANPSD